MLGWAHRWALSERACWACRARARLGVLGAGAAGAGARRASGRAEHWRAHKRWPAGAGGAQTGRRQLERQAQAWARGALGVSLRSARRGRAGRVAWAWLGAQAGRAGWSAGLVLVHSAPGSVLTQYLTGSTRYFS